MLREFFVFSIGSPQRERVCVWEVCLTHSHITPSYKDGVCFLLCVLLLFFFYYIIFFGSLVYGITFFSSSSFFIT